MSEMAELDLSWLPPGVARRQALDEAQHAAEMRREERARQKASEEFAEEAHDKAVAAHMAGAIARGEPVGALDVMTGNIGRTVTEVLTANAELADRVPKEHRDPVNYVGDTGDYFPVQRSRRETAEPGEYVRDRQLRQADELHRDFVAARARYDYGGAVEAARAKQAEPNPGRAVNPGAVARGWCDENGEVTR
jgi:hypothetical protein